MLISDLMTDPDLENEGVWVEYAHGVRLRIARHNNPNYASLVRQRSMAIREGQSGGKMTDEQIRKVVDEATAHHILKGWEGIDEAPDQPAVYSPEKALEYLEHPQLHDMREFILAVSQSVERYRTRSLDAVAGN